MTNIISAKDMAWFVYESPLTCRFVSRPPMRVAHVTAEELNGISEIWACGGQLGNGDTCLTYFPVGFVYVEWEQPA